MPSKTSPAHKEEHIARKHATKGNDKNAPNLTITGGTMATSEREPSKRQQTVAAEEKKAKGKKLNGAPVHDDELEEKSSRSSSFGKCDGKAIKKAQEKTTPKEKYHGRHSIAVTREKLFGSESPNLEKHVEAIRERRMSLPRTIAADNEADVELIIGEDGKPVFQPTVTAKAEEIIKELTELLLEDDDGNLQTKTNSF
ncbi:hypothetical protein GCK32_010162 [Trichostrongylus colubriformis]|uniref:Uncharacterized protein n=1 Tax=Trichostrongylus colubriformis TaxID=6319 RepID=A0AAN8ITD9_TRICO